MYWKGQESGSWREMGRGRGGDEYGIGKALDGKRYVGKGRGWGKELR